MLYIIYLRSCTTLPLNIEIGQYVSLKMSSILYSIVLFYWEVRKSLFSKVFTKPDVWHDTAFPPFQFRFQVQTQKKNCASENIKAKCCRSPSTCSSFHKNFTGRAAETSGQQKRERRQPWTEREQWEKESSVEQETRRQTEDNWWSVQSCQNILTLPGISSENNHSKKIYSNLCFIFLVNFISAFMEVTFPEHAAFQWYKVIQLKISRGYTQYSALHSYSV